VGQFLAMVLQLGGLFAQGSEPGRRKRVVTVTADIDVLTVTLAFLVLQATALGLWVHQMAGFDSAKAADMLAIPDDFVPLTAIAVGHRTDHLTLPTERLRERELARRKRRPIDGIAAEGAWCASLSL
jgi:hypothetical protein